MKKKNKEFILEFVSYFLTMFILVCIAKKLGWITNPVLELSLGLTIGWLIWKAIMVFLNKKNKDK